MTKKHEHDDRIFEVDDSEGCFIKITYEGLVSYAGVFYQGTSDRPYMSTSPTEIDSSQKPNKDGLLEGFSGNSGIKTIGEALDMSFRRLADEHDRRVAQHEFKPDDACKTLHEFFDKL